EALHSLTGRKNGYPPPLFFIFGSVMLLAAIGDARVLGWDIHGAQRVARHLWRMSFAAFIATGSFFLGQAKVIPKPIRIMPLLAIPALLPLVLMLYWLGRVLFTRWYRRTFVSATTMPIATRRSIRMSTNASAVLSATPLD